MSVEVSASPPQVQFPPGAHYVWICRLREAARWANWLVGLIALAGVVGWLGGWPRLTGLGALSPAMLPSSVVVLALLGIGLWALRRRDRLTEGHKLGWEVGAAAAGMACIALLALGHDLRLWARDPPAFESIRVLFDPAPISVGTAWCYLLLSAAMVLASLNGARAGGWARTLAMTVGGVVVVALAALSFRLVRLEFAVPSFGIAFTVAIALLAASFCVIALRPGPRLLELLESESPGVLIARRLLPAVVILPLVASWLQILSVSAGWFQNADGEGLLVVSVIIAGIALMHVLTVRLDDMNRTRTQAERRAAIQKQWLGVTLANIGEAVVTADDKGRISVLNPAAETLLGISAGDAFGRAVDKTLSFVDEASDAPMACPLQAAFRTRRPASLGGEPAVRRADGQLQAVEVTANPIVDASGQLSGGVIVLREVRAQRDRQHVEREAYAALDRRVAERTQALEKAMSMLRENTALLRAVTDSTPELIVAKNRDGRLMMVNPGARQALGLEDADITGRTGQELFGDAAELGRALDSDRWVMESGQPVVVDEVWQVEGRPGTYQITKAPLRDAQGHIFGIVGVAREITELKEAQQALERTLATERRLRVEAERINRAKDEFLAIVSHELRTPLNALKGWGQILAGAHDPDPALITRATDAIRRNVALQTRLIDDLLDTARVISGKLDLSLQRIDLVEVIEAAVAGFREPAEAKGVELRVRVDEDEVMIDGDFDRLQQVFGNLLSNAIKFTPEGGKIELALSLAPSSVEISVSDDGIGIERDFLPLVFDRFSQADPSLTRRYFGLGIGLALVRSLVELHGGTVAARSEGEGSGTCFTVTLPRRQPSALCTRPGITAKAETAKAETAKALDGVTVVLVDDDPDARELMELMLARAGARTRSFDSGEKLLAAWRTAALSPPPAVVLFDIAMPGGSGFQILEQLRALAGGERPCAIAVTALSHLPERHFTAAGFAGRVDKPIDEHALIQTIVGVLAAARRSDAPRNVRHAQRL